MKSPLTLPLFRLGNSRDCHQSSVCQKFVMTSCVAVRAVELCSQLFYRDRRFFL